jgi:hypothetical protein
MKMVNQYESQKGWSEMLCKLYWEFTDEQGQKKWLRLAYSHAESYEDALKKLLRKRFRVNFDKDDRFVLVWVNRKRQIERVDDVTKAVIHKLKKWKGG